MVHGVLADAQEREEIGNQNRKALVALMQEFNLNIAVREFDDWRPTQRNSGDLVGLESVSTVKIVATNGVLAWFVREDVCLLGHKSNFTGKVKPLFGARKPTRPKADRRKPKLSPLEQAMELLAQLQKGTE